MLRESEAATAGAARDSESYGAQAVVHAFRILDVLSAEPAALGVSELSRRVGLSKSVVHRLVRTMVVVGWLELDPASLRYRLGLGLFELGSLFASQLEIRQRARPHLEALRDRHGESAYLAVLADGLVVHVAVAESPHTLRARSTVGQREHAHCTSLGKVLLAHAPAGTVEALAARGLTRFTPHTLTDLDALRAELAEVRARGYATNVEESERGLIAVSAPVRDRAGSVVAAVGVAAPLQRVPPRERRALTAAVLNTAAAISRALGAPASLAPAAPDGDTPKWAPGGSSAQPRHAVFAAPRARQRA